MAWWLLEQMRMKTPERESGQPNMYALDQTRSNYDQANAIQEAKQRIEKARAKMEEAESDLKGFTKTHRDEARKGDRRALLVGKVVLRMATENQEVWTKLWPRIEQHLQEQSDADRALFGLTDVARTDKAEVSAAAKPAAENGSAQLQDQPMDEAVG